MMILLILRMWIWISTRIWGTRREALISAVNARAKPSSLLRRKDSANHQRLLEEKRIKRRRMPHPNRGRPVQQMMQQQNQTRIPSGFEVDWTERLRESI